MALEESNSGTVAGGRLLCWGGAALGLIGLIGCVAGVEALATIVPGQPPMVPGMCLALIFLGLAGALRDPGGAGSAIRFSTLASAVVLVLVLLMLAQRLPGFPLSLNQLLVPGQTAPYTRPSVPAAIALALLSCAILSYQQRAEGRFHPAEWLIVCAGLISFAFALLPLFDPDPAAPFSPTIIAGVPAPVAISLVLISTGLLLQEPNSGVMQIANSATPGGMMLRQLIPAVIMIVLALGLAASLLTDIAGPENAAFVRAGATLFGIAIAFPLFLITARHLNRAHEALERSEVRYRELVQLAADGIFVADLQGRFTEVNDAGCRLLGFSREEILGKTIMDFILPEDKERLFRDRDKFLKGGSDVSEWMMLRRDGTYVPVEVSAKILPDGRWIAIDRDMSERKQAEEALRLSEGAAKQASQARDDMLAVVAHDLRNPLATIATLAAVLQRTGPQHDIGDEIAHAADRMTRLIEDLIDVALLDAGTFSIKQGRIRPTDILSEVYDSQALLASSASLELRIEAMEDLPDISADRDRLLQVFENLIGNALKFTKAGGEIVLGATARENEVAFSVRDTGSGIPGEQLPHVFDRFWQGRDGNRGGAGLGLPIVKGIVEAQGGRVWVQSTPNQGSTFFFTVSIAKASDLREQKRA